MFVHIVLFSLFVTEFVGAVQDKETRRFVIKSIELPEIKHGEKCITGKIYKMACNTCRCGTNNVLLCTKMKCYSKWTTFSKTSHLRNAEGEENPNLSGTTCNPGKIYKEKKNNDCKKCICNCDGVPECVSINCNDESAAKIDEHLENMLQRVDETRLPVLVHSGAECQPGNKYRVDCNVCLCNEDGNLKCTHKYCLQVGYFNKQLALKETGKSCAPGFESEHDCVKCVCINGVLKCDPILNCDHNSLHGALRTNGQQVKTTLDLAKKEVCLHGQIYKSDCNKCFCHEGVLRCTVKKCLNYRESIQLQDDLKKLENES